MHINYYLSWELKYYQKFEMILMQNTCFFFPLRSAGGLLCSSGIVPTDCFSSSSSLSPHYEGHGQTSAGAAAH